MFVSYVGICIQQHTPVSSNPVMACDFFTFSVEGSFQHCCPSSLISSLVHALHYTCMHKVHVHMTLCSVSKELFVHIYISQVKSRQDHGHSHWKPNCHQDGYPLHKVHVCNSSSTPTSGLSHNITKRILCKRPIGVLLVACILDMR